MTYKKLEPCSIFLISVTGDCATCGHNFESHLTPVNKSNDEGGDIVEGYCQECKIGLIPERITFEERCDTCGTLVDWVKIRKGTSIEQIVTSQMKKKVDEMPTEFKLREWAIDWGKQHPTQESKTAYLSGLCTFRRFILTNLNN